jgi:hypothetical protein
MYIGIYEEKAKLLYRNFRNQLFSGIAELQLGYGSLPTYNRSMVGVFTRFIQSFYV